MKHIYKIIMMATGGCGGGEWNEYICMLSPRGTNAEQNYGELFKEGCTNDEYCIGDESFAGRKSGTVGISSKMCCTTPRAAPDGPGRFFWNSWPRVDVVEMRSLHLIDCPSHVSHTQGVKIHNSDYQRYPMGGATTRNNPRPILLLLVLVYRDLTRAVSWRACLGYPG